ncbi:CPBP family intramembrane glutamic endopeptidase [Bifidobacterium scaligerum]|uniref:CPBP family intramembrane metalloprotease domain-containing protein n=1 Tax=Bifidobacterium scaligerum TaxID=2052656 RepID=A0A2M9HQ26_9BIFI|nr:type II CAAX endopeptidase family protein [Bifidobacterium scaligerum]PJM78914.1 CPBP family intramembrane metalloprotease domain-containing protein [Bifidobacterium scaligerum]
MSSVSSSQTFFTIARRRFSLIGMALIAVVVLWVGLNIALSHAIAPLFDDHIPTWVLLLVSSGPLYLVAMPLSLLLLKRVPAIETIEYPMRLGEFLQMFIMCIPVMYLGSIIGNVLSLGVTNGQATNRIGDLVSGDDIWINTIFIAILAPICEEWLFRKQIISRLRRYGEKTAIVLSAIAFGLFHINLFQFFYAFGLGLIFGYIYTRTSRLRYTIVLHMLINLNGSLIAPLVIKQIDPRILNGTMSEEEIMRMAASPDAGMGGMAILGLYGMVLIGLMIAGIVLLIVKRKSWEFYPAPDQLPVGSVVRTAYGNIGVIIYLLITVGLTVWMLMQ